MEFTTTLISALILAVVSAYMVMKRTRATQKRQGPPEAAGAWPLLGHIHLVGANRLLHRTLAAMADTYGPIFSLRLGVHRALVVSNWEVAKDCFTVNDRSLSTRPTSIALKNMGYDHTMLGFAPYGPYWRDMRKLSMCHLLSARRLEPLQHVRDSETRVLIQGLYRQWSEKREPISMEMKEVLGDFAMNVIMRKVAGRRYSGCDPESRRCQNTLINFSRLLGAFFVSDLVPALAWLDVINGNLRYMKKTGQELEDLLSCLIKEHRQRKLVGPIHEDEKDFIDVMLSVMDDGKTPAQEIDTAIIGTCMALILGGNDTTVVTLTWALSLLLNNPDKLKKLQDELEAHIGNHRPVDGSGVRKLIYLQAVIKETLRLYPAAPLSAPREALEDCIISGYKVPKGTRVFTNLWKLHRDPTIWKNPSEFIPERFLHEHAKLEATGQDFEYLPFGAGRRMCPGASFALQSIHLTLARLLHAFEPKRMSDVPVDMTEGPGIVSPKATPLKVLLTPKETVGLYI